MTIDKQIINLYKELVKLQEELYTETLTYLELDILNAEMLRIKNKIKKLEKTNA